MRDFCSLYFEDRSALDQSFGVHASWNKTTGDDCVLHVFFTRSAAEAFRATLPAKEAASFKRTPESLPAASEQPTLVFEGSVAATLTNCFIEHAKILATTEVMVSVSAEPQLCGFLQPPARGRHPGILMWQDPRTEDYHVLIAHSRAQVLDALGAMDWLGDHKDELMRKARKWNLLPKSPREPQRIGGAAATVLCQGSLASRAIRTRETGKTLH